MFVTVLGVVSVLAMAAAFCAGYEFGKRFVNEVATRNDVDMANLQARLAIAEVALRDLAEESDLYAAKLALMMIDNLG